MPRSNLKKGRIKIEQIASEDESSEENEESTSWHLDGRAQLPDRNLGASQLSKIPPSTVTREDLSANLVSVASALVSNSAVNLQMAVLLAQAAATMTGLSGNRSPLEVITQTLNSLGFSLPSIPTSVPCGLIPGCSSAIHEPPTSDAINLSTSSKTDDSERSTAFSDGSLVYDSESHVFDTSIKPESDPLQDSDRESHSTEVTQSISSTCTTSYPRECTNTVSTPDVISDSSLSPKPKEGLLRPQSVVSVASTPLPIPLNELPDANRLSTPHTTRKVVTCTLCNKIIQRSSLREHMILHTNTGKFPCPFCSKKCICASTLKQHLRVHTGERPFKCPQCPKAYKQHGMLKRHLLGHSGKRPYVCRLCGFAMHTRTSLTRHFRTHGIQKKVAEAPELWFKSDAPPETVFSIASDVGLVLTAEEVTTLSQHKADPESSNIPVANNTVVPKDCVVLERRFVCDVCPAGFPSKQAMQSHRRHAHGQRYPYKCYECDEVFSNVVLRSAHASLKHPHVCPHCSAVMSNRRRGTLRAHIREHHPEISGLRPPAAMANDEPSKRTDNTGDRPSNSVDNSTGLSSSNKADDSVVTIPAQPTHLIATRIEHTKEQSFQNESHSAHSESQSTSSPALFNSVKRIRDHRLNRHRFMPPTSCRLPSSLYTNIGKFCCRLCPRMFTRSNQIAVHIRWHLGAKPFKCSHCPKAFRRRVKLKMHIKFHKNVCPYTCRLCDRNFVSRAKLSCHLHTHGVNKALDKVPNLWFKYAAPKKAVSGLPVKVAQTSQDQATSPTRSSVVLSPSTLPTQPNSDSSGGSQAPLERKFLCDNCSACFSNYQALRSHQLRLHGAYCPHKCTDCDERFSNFKAMRSHRHKVHPLRCPFCSEAMPRRITALLESHIRCFHPEQFLVQSDGQQLWKNEKNHIRPTSEPLGDTASIKEAEDPKHHETQVSLCENRELWTNSSTSITTSNVFSQTTTAGVSRTGPNTVGSDPLTVGFPPPTNSDFRCEMCPEAFATYVVLQSHKLGVHGVSQPYKCSQCEEVFPRKKQLEKHCRQTHPLRCRFCAEVMPRRRVALLDSHVRLMHPEQYSTSWAQSASQPIEHLDKKDCPRAHNELLRDTPSANEENSTTDSNLFSTGTDTNVNHTQSADSPSKLLDNLPEHESSSSLHNLEASCDSAVLSQSIPLGTPVWTPDLEKFCASHERDTVRNRLIQRESPGKHMDTQQNSNNFICPHCPKTFSCSSMLARHAVVHTDEKPFKCPHCPRVYKYRAGWQQHQRSHKGLRPFICRLCGLALASGPSLAFHLRTHNIKKPFSEVPELWFRSDASPNEVLHIAAEVGRAITEEEKKFENIPDQSHHPDDVPKDIAIRTRKYLCDLCPAGFPSSSALRSHRLTTHGITGSVKCVECNEVFVNRHRYKIHLRLAHPLVCPICSAVMPQRLRPLLWKHIRENHLKQTERDPSTLAAVSGVEPPAGSTRSRSSSKERHNLDNDKVQSIGWKRIRPSISSNGDTTASEQFGSVLENDNLSSIQTPSNSIQKFDEHTSEQGQTHSASFDFVIRAKGEETANQ